MRRPEDAKIRATLLHDHVFRRLDDLPPTIISTVLARSVHDLGITAIIALHELGGLQFIIVGGAPLPGPGL